MNKKWPSLFDSLPQEWRDFIFLENDLNSISNFVEEQYLTKTYSIYPKKADLFSAFDLKPPDVKCIILGQDPYHGPNQAHGLSFSVKEDVYIPPSLKNIFKELKTDLGLEIPNSGYLEKWKQQGVFLLNTILTVERSKPKSHENKGWEDFTKSIIKSLSDERENLVFILWGSNAISYAQYINAKKHLILTSVHPSPMSSYRGFFGSKPFSKTNNYLKQHNIKEIDWSL